MRIRTFRKISTLGLLMVATTLPILITNFHAPGGLEYILSMSASIGIPLGLLTSIALRTGHLYDV